jgi:hypothetical protein
VATTQDSQRHSRGGIPDPGGVVLARGDDSASVGTEGRAEHGSAVAAQRSHSITIYIPHAGGAVTAPSEDTMAIWVVVLAHIP